MDAPKEVTRVQLALRAVISGIAVTLLWCAMDRVHRVETRSIPEHLTLVVGGPVHLGDLVEFQVNRDPVIPPERLPAVLTKRVACLAPSVLSWHDAAFWCDGQNLGGVIHQTLDHRPLLPFHWDGPIPAGQAFVMGTHPHSYDSRYLGFIAVDRLQKVWGLI